MNTLAADPAHVLIERLIACSRRGRDHDAVTMGEAEALLHPGVELHRLDGEVIEGREAVLDALRGGDASVGLRVVSIVEAATVRVALTVEGLPGRLEFHVSAQLESGRLRVVRMH